MHLLALLPVLVIAAVFSVPQLRALRVFSLMPYSSFWFFAFFIGLALALFLFRRSLARRMSYAGLMFALNLAFYIFLFPKPVHALFFAAYFYCFYWLAQRAERRLPTWEALFFTLLPMIVARSTREIQFVGLSYITFRAFHLIMDAPYMERIPPRRYFTFLMFFPALLAGPIDRWQNFGPQLEKGFENIRTERLAIGYRLILLGAVMKFVLAELIQDHVLVAGWTAPTRYFTEFYGYPAFLYFDFAGYSAMAIGCAMMLGLILPENFNRPYLSRNAQDFWRRFHITLGEWLKDYFFKPIYKWLHSRPGLAGYPLLKQNVAIFLTFFLMGCWNGFKKHYLISGALFGFYSVVYNCWIFWGKRRGGTPRLMGSERLTRWAAIFVTVNACCLALYYFGGRTELFQ